MLNFPARDKIINNSTWHNACMNNPGGLPIPFSKIVSPLEAEMNIELTRRWARKHSKTGLEIMNLVSSKTSNLIHVIAWRGEGADEGFTMFDSDSPLPGEGTVFVNLDVFVQIVESQGQQNKSDTMNNFVVILHEIGHAKQFIEMPLIFTSGALDSSSPANQSRSLASANYDKQVQQRAMELKGKGMKYSDASKTVQRELGKPPHVAFSSIVEWDNYQRHEGPICDEAGITRRGFYGNIRSLFPSVVSW
jgi:hypothetical protein